MCTSCCKSVSLGSLRIKNLGRYLWFRCPVLLEIVDAFGSYIFWICKGLYDSFLLPLSCFLHSLFKEICNIVTVKVISCIISIHASLLMHLSVFGQNFCLGSELQPIRMYNRFCFPFLWYLISYNFFSSLDLQFLELRAEPIIRRHFKGSLRWNSDQTQSRFTLLQLLATTRKCTTMS